MKTAQVHLIIGTTLETRGRKKMPDIIVFITAVCWQTLLKTSSADKSGTPEDNFYPAYIFGNTVLSDKLQH